MTDPIVWNGKTALEISTDIAANYEAACADFECPVVVTYGGHRIPGKSRLLDGLLHLNLEICEADVRRHIEELLQLARKISVSYKRIAVDEAAEIKADAWRHLKKAVEADSVKIPKPSVAQWKREQRNFGRSCK